jgi:hypothetical protein
LKKLNNQTTQSQTLNSTDIQSKYTESANTINEIVNFLDCSTGLKYKITNQKVSITQKEDSKEMSFELSAVEKVLCRQDFDGSSFLQVNFHSGFKVLITKHLVGFKPAGLVGFDSQKIPKVVTTVDLKSVVTAIEETYEDDSFQTEAELEILKKVYHSILLGAESVGFEMSTERHWFLRSMLNKKAATA